MAEFNIRQLIPLRHDSYKKTRDRPCTGRHPRRLFIAFDRHDPENYTRFQSCQRKLAIRKARKLYSKVPYGSGKTPNVVCYEYTSIHDGYTWDRVL